MDFETYPFEKLNLLLNKTEKNRSFDMIDLTIGEPQFPTPGFIKKELCSNAELLNRYPKTSGEIYLKSALQEYMRQRFGLKLGEEQLIPTFGTRELLFNFPQFILSYAHKPKMAFPNPFYQIYEGAAIASRAEIVHINLEEKNRFKPVLDKERLKGCNLVILNTPNNPTSSVLSFDEMKEWVEAAMELDFVLLNDECYIDLYTDSPIPSMLEAAVASGNPEFRNLFVINSISKRSSAPGLRSGFIAGDKNILEQYMKYRTYIGCASPLPLQKASAAAWRDREYPERFRDKYRENFKLANTLLGTEIPQATFYIWLKTNDDISFTREIYTEYGIKVLPGSFLGRNGAGRGYIRLALVHEKERMREAMERIKVFREKRGI